MNTVPTRSTLILIKKTAPFFAVIAAIGLTAITSCTKAVWPEYKANGADVAELNERYDGTSGIYHDESYVAFLQDYSVSGDYLNYGKWKNYFNDGLIVVNANGLPQVRTGDDVYWNAVTLSHYALMMHGRYLRGDKPSLDKFFQAADKLVELQSANGGFPYPTMSHRHNSLPEGWNSAMAQGNALSVFARALLIRDEPRYRQAGEKAFINLMTPMAEGGTHSTMADLDPSLSGFVFFLEYPNTPADYTLNGYMFTLLGLYDWSQTQSSTQDEAEDAFEDGMSTLTRILPYYDAEGFSTYDLAHIVLKSKPYVAPEYLGIHVHLLHAINSIAPDKIIASYEKKWAAKIDEMNKSLRITTRKIDNISPQPLGKTMTIKLATKGGTGGKILYRTYIKFNGEWTTLAEYSYKDTFKWTPKVPGEYILGFYAKEENSQKEWDNFRYQTFIVN